MQKSLHAQSDLKMVSGAIYYLYNMNNSVLRLSVSRESYTVYTIYRRAPPRKYSAWGGIPHSSLARISLKGNFKMLEFLHYLLLLYCSVHIIYGIVRPFELGGETRLIRSTAVNWRPCKFFKILFLRNKNRIQHLQLYQIYHTTTNYAGF